MPEATSTPAAAVRIPWAVRRIRLITVVILFDGVWLIASDVAWTSIAIAALLMGAVVCGWILIASRLRALRVTREAGKQSVSRPMPPR